MSYNNGAIELLYVTDMGLNIKTTTTTDNNPSILTLATGELDIQQDDVIGQINFYAPDESSGGDANLTCASVSAISEGDFSATSNATKL